MYTLQDIVNNKRLAYEALGHDDRTKFVYQGDLTRRFLTQDAGRLVEEIGLRDSIEIFNMENTLPPKLAHVLPVVEPAFKKFLQFMGRSVSQKEIDEALIDAAGNASFFLEHAGERAGVVEIGPGNCLTALFLAELLPGITVMYCVEGSAQHFWYQQMFWRFMSTFGERYQYVPQLFQNQDRRNADEFRPKRTLIRHIPLWNLDDVSSDLNNFPVMANRVLDRVCAHDLKLIVESQFVKNSDLLIARGGLCRDTIHDLYLYGYGTYHGINVIDQLKDIGFVAHLELEGGELSAVFERSSKVSKEMVSKVKFISQRLREQLTAGVPQFVWIDDDFPFAEDFEFLYDCYKCAYNDSLATGPLPLKKMNRKSLDELNFKSGDQLLVLSARAAEIRKKMNKRFLVDIKAKSISTLITILEAE